MSVIHIEGKDHFQTEVLDYQGVALVDFYAEWCGPCKMIAPVMEELGEAYQGKAKIVKVNVDNNPEAAQQFGVSNIPAVFVVKNGDPIKNIVGANPADFYKSELDAALA